MLDIYIGWDAFEDAAYRTLRFSLFRRTSAPLRVHRLDVRPLRDEGILTRPIEWKDGQRWCPISQAPMATEFAISRFAVPFSAPPDAPFALFLDCDMLATDDVAKLFREFDPKFAVQVVKHNHIGAEGVKMGGLLQSSYPRKNWSSAVLWNLRHPANKRLTLDMLNALPGRDLHRFCWLDDDEIGDLSPRWNHLINVQTSEPGRGLLHYTLGGPWLPNWTPAPYDRLWSAEYEILRSDEEHYAAPWSIG